MTITYGTRSPSASPTPELPELAEPRGRAGVGVLDRVGTVRDCPRCGLRTAWTGCAWEHCSTGTSGTLSCPIDPANVPKCARPMAGWDNDRTYRDTCGECGEPVLGVIMDGGYLTDSRVRMSWWHSGSGSVTCGTVAS